MDDRLTLTAGFRYAQEKNDTRLEAVDFAGGSSTFGASTDYSVFLPKVGLRYELSSDVQLVAVVQKGFRAGGAGGSYFTSRPFVYDPEFTWNYEAGLRAGLFDGSGSAPVFLRVCTTT